jgi:Tol biopolymer transport system component
LFPFRLPAPAPLARLIVAALMLLATATDLALAPTTAAAAAVFLPTSTTGTTALDPSQCKVTSATKLSDGGDQDWSHALNLLAFTIADSNNVHQLYTMRPDGSAKMCLTCGLSSGPARATQHKFNPIWHSSGKWLIVQVERDNWLSWLNGDKAFSEVLLNGLWSDLYATTPDGRVWYKLTDTGLTTDGAAFPHLSADGTKLVWSRLMAPASATAPFGEWRLLTADFVVQNGAPVLQNQRDLTPSTGRFFEAHGFSPDGRNVIITSDIASTNPWEKDIWTIELATGTRKNLTADGQWNEHSKYSPSGVRISYMSSRPYWIFLQTDLWVMAADGSAKSQLTHFNVPGYPEYMPGVNMVGRSSWSADGSRLAVTAGASTAFPNRNLWMLTFAGRCGA